MHHLLDILRQEVDRDKIAHERIYHLENGRQLAVIAAKEQNSYQVGLATDIPAPLIFHWGVASLKSGMGLTLFITSTGGNKDIPKHRRPNKIYLS